MYCDRQGHEAAGLCRDTGPRHGHAGHDTEQGRAATRLLGPRYGRPRPRYSRAKAYDTAPLLVRARGLRAPCARPGSIGCALGAPNQFLGSVHCFSHCLDIVHEHCSQNFFEKNKNK